MPRTVRSLSLIFVCVGLLGCSAEEPSESFTVVAYNLENVFDVDGVAIFDDYQQGVEGDPSSYSRFQLLTKLENAVKVLSALEREGPEVILIQELENDFTTESSVTDFDAFLQSHEGKTVHEMIVNDWQPEYAGIPSVAWLLKMMDDVDMDGYEVVVAPPKDLETGIAHVNAIFSRFPINQVFFHPIPDARDIIEAELLVDGSSLWVYNNHWKSGASNPKREPIRVENAKALRALIDARFEDDPQADIVIGGDLNAHYNHSILFPEIETGINDVLGSRGDESFDSGELYNLWFELSPEARYSEVWRGNRGTLMHLIVSNGLYDASGVSYVDGSYDKHLVGGLNADALGRPLAWHSAGKRGGGTSDHFPVFARFSRAPFVLKGALSGGDDAPDYEIPLAYETGMSLNLPEGDFLVELDEEAFAAQVGKLYAIEAELEKLRPMTLLVAGQSMPAYVPERSLIPVLKEAMDEGPAMLVVSPGFWKGKRQFVVEGIR